MKKFILIAFLMVSFVSFAQKREKIKGTKNVTLSNKETKPFDTVEVEDNIEVYFVKGTTQAIEIETDDNLHDVIMAEVKGRTLRLYTSKEISGAKQITVRITYTPSLKSITAKHESVVYALNDLEIDSLRIKNIDFSKSFINVKAKSFSLIMDDKTKTDLNLKADNATIQLSKNAEIKALIACPNLKLDMYQKTIATVEGDAATAQIRIDNMAVFTGKKFTVKNLDLTAESYSKSNIMVSDTLTMSASGKAEINLYGAPANVTMRKFADSAVIAKKEQ